MKRASFLKRGKGLARGKGLGRKARLRNRRPTDRRSGRVRNLAYLAAVRQLPCIVGQGAIQHSDLCAGRTEADHQGERPLGRKADDDTAVPMCRRHHRQRTDASHNGPWWFFKKGEMQPWCDIQIAKTRERLNYTPGEPWSPAMIDAVSAEGM